MLNARLLSATRGRSSVVLSRLPRNRCYLSSQASTDNSIEDQAYAEEVIDTEGEWAGCTRKFLAPLRISVRGSDILTNPLFNKGTSFKSGERDRLRIRGLTPPRITNMDTQCSRVIEMMRREKKYDSQKYYSGRFA